MGASLNTTRSRGNSMKEAYSNAVEDAIHEYGNDSYNGTISTTNGVVDMTNEYRKSGKGLEEYAEYLYENDRLNKWGSAVGICIGEPILNTNKIKSTVTTTPQKGTRTWKTMYEVRLWDKTVIGSSEFQADAITLARKHTEKTKDKTYVHITKALVNSQTLVSEINYKPAHSESMGLYYFICLAAE
jgi:hypothetical protein